MKKLLLFVYLPLATAYLVLSYVYPTDPDTIAHRNLSMSQARLFAFSVVIPLISVWLVAIYGAYRFKQHSATIKQHSDGGALDVIAKGLVVLAIFLPIQSVFKIAMNYVGHLHPSLTTITDILITYISLLLPLIAYLYISKGARSLMDLVNPKIQLRPLYALTILFVLIGVSFSYAAFAGDTLTPRNWLVFTQFDMSEPIRMLTVVAPYLFIWFLGLLATYEIYLYQKNVDGICYRQCLRRLSLGLVVGTIGSISIIYLTTMAANLQHWPLVVVVSIAYIALIVTGGAFIMIAQGVERFKMIEEA
jgi:hypothetical protein